MTGFARAAGQNGTFSWVWELKSVNGKSLEPRFRLPPGFDFLEPSLRASLAERIRRGNINIALTVTDGGRSASVRINRDVLEDVMNLIRELEGTIDAAPPRLDGLLSIRGVMELAEELPDEAELQRRQAMVLESWAAALADLVTMRAAEGDRLARLLDARLDEIVEQVGRAEALAILQPAALRERFRAQVTALLEAAPALSEDRLLQEAALLAAKADIREELDRLKGHVVAARELLADPEPIGRRFDFLCQEFNRETNTLCSKSADLDLTRIGLALKVAVEQLREQVQNVE
jgi:uncharacterized protein (TIGR00255 family)